MKTIVLIAYLFKSICIQFVRFIATFYTELVSGNSKGKIRNNKTLVKPGGKNNNNKLALLCGNDFYVLILTKPNPKVAGFLPNPKF